MFVSPRPLVAAAPLSGFGRAAALRAPAPPFRVAVDLSVDLFSMRWWRGVVTLGAMGVGLGLLAPPPEPLPGGPVADFGPDQARQAQAIGIGALDAGSPTGMAMGEGPRARPIAVAPERLIRELSLDFNAGDELERLLVRNGTTPGDAVQAAVLARAAGAVPLAGTRLDLRLGAPGPGGRPVERLHYRARLDLDLTLTRGAGGLAAERTALAVDRTPLRIRGSANGGLYWALRSAGASPATASDYLQAIGASIDVGAEIGSNDRFELVVAQARGPDGAAVAGPLLYAGLDRAAASDLSLVRWPVGGRLQWIDETEAVQPTTSLLGSPVSGRVTSGFGRRVHPILRLARMHRGMDFGAPSGTPIVAVADGQVVRAGWAGGYGRQVRIAHGDGLLTSYSHMSGIVSHVGGIVRRGELIGYVGSSGLSTGPHLHYEVWKNGQAVDPAGVTLTRRPAIGEGMMAAVRTRARALRGR